MTSLRDKIIAECNLILDFNHKYLQQLVNINEYFVSLITPKNMDGDSHQNVIIQFRLNFEELCIALMANGIKDPDKMTVLRFYSALKYFETKNKTKRK
jgi:hypothetical protein